MHGVHAYELYWDCYGLAAAAVRSVVDDGIRLTIIDNQRILHLLLAFT